MNSNDLAQKLEQTVISTIVKEQRPGGSLYRAGSIPRYNKNRVFSNQMVSTPDQEPTNTQLLQEIQAIRALLTQQDERITEQGKDLERQDKWQDRTWDVIKWVGGIAVGLAISASIAIIGILIEASAYPVCLQRG